MEVKIMAADKTTFWEHREQIDDLIRKHEAINKEAFEEARKENTNRFGWVDEVAMNEARAIYQLGKQRLSLRSLEFETDAVTLQMVETCCVSAIEAKLNSQLIARKVQRLEMMVLAVFAIIVGGYLSSMF
jgi:aldehyde:ferredoxin oxidoreductase